MAAKSSKDLRGEIAPTLKRLVVTVAQELVVAGRALGPDPKLTSQGNLHADAAQAAALSLGQESAHLASVLLALLGPQTPFEDARDLTYFVINRCILHPDFLLMSTVSPGRQDQFWTDLLHSVENPLNTFRFSVPLIFAAPYVVDGAIGGDDALALFTEEHDGTCTVMLKGAVRACTGASAAAAVERLVDTVLGALQAAQLAGCVFERVVAPRGVSIQFEAESVLIHPACAYRVSSTYATLPATLSELERLQWERGDLANALARVFRVLRSTLSLGKGRAEEVRNACRLAHVAIHATDFGLLVALAFTVMEGLLLDPNSTDSVTAKLSEAVAHNLGKSAEDRATYRKQVKRLYELRSMFTHTGFIRGRHEARDEVLALMLKVLFRSMEELSDSQSPEPHEPGT